jgi:mRNA-degrading endonuclease YafQ of YafQ-DinJ toxin-antitoxin module
MRKDLLASQPSLEKVIFKKVKWFKTNPNDSRLKNHALKRRMKGKFSFSITDDIRIIYERMGKNTVRFLAIGGHSKVYVKIK